MDFDEYEYLEKEVENLDEKSKKAANGGDDNVKSRGKERSSRSSKHRGRDDDSKDHRDKKSKTGDDSRDSDKRGEKGSSRHRSRSREGDRSERDRDRHSGGKDYRDEKNGKERGGRDSERDRDGDRRNRDRDRTKGREHQHDRDQRSRSISERHGDDGEKPQERNFKERDVIGGDRKSRHHKEKKEDGTEPEADPERDQRTVFAYQIALKAHERDVYEFFSRAGKVRDVQLIMDRNSRRSKGFGYIEFYDVMSVPMAIALSGQPLLGHPVMVKPSEAEKNLVQPTSTAAGTAGASDPYAGRKLYVGNLHYNISEEQLRQVFESFGSVDLVQLPLDETGHCKGFGFVQFARLEDAKAAQTLNGQLEIAGRVIKVSAVTDQTSGTQDAMKSTGELDDDEGGGLSLNAHSRALLMAKLDRTGTASSINSLGTGIVNGSGLSTASAPIHGVQPALSSLTAPILQASVSTFGGSAGTGLSVPTVTVPSINSIGVPSECLMLNNMFDPTLEAEPDFDLDIKEDVQEECSKFGSLKHISVDKNSAGHVYLRFDTTQAAVSAQRALNGRWFAGKMITAIFMVPQNYEAKFPESI